MKIGSVIFFLLVILLMAGCAAHENPEALRLQNRAKMSIEDGTSRTYPRSGDYETNDAARDFDEKTARSDGRAQKIADAVTALQSIDKASVVVTGNTAIVGIELAVELNDENLIKAKGEVSDAVKACDGEIDHVTVTASDELIKRINGISDSASGRKTEGGENGVERKVPDYDDHMEKVVSELTPRV
ncbi:MAG: YhcN/YlaJ family sporulation lipoprotein [Defluviitaleaceae bacterium]|nr:YhcN/YlaJ family sporulation lipoprotein [Defluviitaleaceae bacterium]